MNVDKDADVTTCSCPCPALLPDMVLVETVLLKEALDVVEHARAALIAFMYLTFIDDIDLIDGLRALVRKIKSVLEKP